MISQQSLKSTAITAAAYEAVMPGYFTRTSKQSEKQAKNRQFNRKTSPTSMGRKIKCKPRRQIQKTSPK